MSDRIAIWSAPASFSPGVAVLSSTTGSLPVMESMASLSDGTGYRDQPGRIGRDQRLWSDRGRRGYLLVQEEMNVWAV